MTSQMSQPHAGGNVITSIRFPKHWDEIRRIRALSTTPAEELAQRVHNVVELGSSLRDRPAYQDAVWDSVLSAETALHAMIDLCEKLDKLPAASLLDFQNVVSETLGQDGKLTELLSHQAVRGRLFDATNDIQFARLILGRTMNLDIQPFAETRQKRRVQAEFLDPITVSAMSLWKELTGKAVVSVKGLSAEGPFGVRPDKDDAFFVYLCLNMIADVDASKAITAIRRVQKAEGTQTNTAYLQRLGVEIAARLAKG